MELKAALVGCGAMSRAWLQAAARIPDLRIVGLADLDATRAKERAAEFSLKDPVVASDVHALIAESRPDLLFDVVVPSARHEVVSAGLAAGCHVLSEKPMAETLADARDLVARAKAAGRIHAVVQNRRYLAGVRRIARAVRSGAIGAITSVHADFFLAPHFGGFREEMDHVLLLDMAIHTLRRPALHDRIGRVERLLPRMEPAAVLVSTGLFGGGDLRTRERRRLCLSRLMVRARVAHVVGKRLALRRRERRADLGRVRSDPDRGFGSPANAGASSTR